MKPTCNADGCNAPVAHDRALCPQHWGRVPHSLKGGIGLHTRLARRDRARGYGLVNDLRADAAHEADRVPYEPTDLF